MGFEIQDLGVASATYLALFGVYNILSHYVMYKIWSFKLVYLMLWFYGLLRIGGQISGVGFAVEGFAHYQWLVAYIVLTVEGYFMLVFGTFYMLMREEVLVHGYSLMNQGFFKIDGKRGAATLNNPSPRYTLYYVLIIANVLLAVGGAMLAGASPEELINNAKKVDVSKALRTIGQLIFLIGTVLITGLTIYQREVRNVRTKAVCFLIAAAPFLWVRGVYGVLSIYVDQMNYLAITNYFTPEAHKKLTIYEYVLGTTMEFVAAVILLNTYWVRSPDPEERSETTSNSIDTEKKALV